MKTQKFITESRKRLNLTQKELSEKLSESLNRNIERYNIAKYETGVTIPPGDIILTVIELLKHKQ